MCQSSTLRWGMCFPPKYLSFHRSGNKCGILFCQLLNIFMLIVHSGNGDCFGKQDHFGELDGMWFVKLMIKKFWKRERSMCVRKSNPCQWPIYLVFRTHSIGRLHWPMDQTRQASILTLLPILCIMSTLLWWLRVSICLLLFGILYLLLPGNPVQ